MSIAVVIVNFRTAGLTVACLESIAADGWVPCNGRVIVVDNASGDGSAEVIRGAVEARGWGEWVEVVEADRNGGFAYGNNVGIRRALESDDRLKYLLLLNPDTVVRPGAMEALVRHSQAHPRSGICGARLLDGDGRPQCSGFRFPTVFGEFESGMRFGPVTKLLKGWVIPRPVSDVAGCVDWVSGACLLVRREALEQVGLLDEGFFMYYEEVDLCRRAKLVGWEVWHVPQAQVVHLEGAASGIRVARKPRPRYWYDSRRWYFQKSGGGAYAALAEMAYEVGYVTWRMRRVVQQKPDNDPLRRLRDGFRYVVLGAMRGSGV